MTEPTDPKPAETTMADKPARKRRTKAEIEAANASDDSAKPKRGGRRSKADEAGEPAGSLPATFQLAIPVCFLGSPGSHY